MASRISSQISGYKKGRISGKYAVSRPHTFLYWKGECAVAYSCFLRGTKNEFVKSVKMSLKREKSSRISGIRPHQISGIQKNQYPMHSSACIITRIKLTERAACPGGHLSAGEGSCLSTLHQCTITIWPLPLKEIFPDYVNHPLLVYKLKISTWLWN